MANLSAPPPALVTVRSLYEALEEPTPVLVVVIQADTAAPRNAEEAPPAKERVTVPAVTPAPDEVADVLR